MKQYELAIEAKEEAMVRVEANANRCWLDFAYAFTILIADEGVPFSSCDVWDRMMHFRPDLHTHEKRALGPIMRKAARAGFIVKHSIVPSGRIHNHHRPIQLWVAAP